ncbi:MAG: hypothetical protein HRU41_31635 [Saprospiraceae bacterium]|nr:hypothetical protein [Saprospiraceae bacterium]
MDFPEKIPITRVEEYHTSHIGLYEGDKQFWCYQTFVQDSEGLAEGASWEKYRREYVVLFLFDQEGNLEKAQWEFAGTTDFIQFDTEAKIEEMTSRLRGVTFGDIEIKPFKVEIDGYQFGLIPNQEAEMIELQPGSTIAFSEPWDGEYYT